MSHQGEEQEHARNVAYLILLIPLLIVILIVIFA